MGSSSPQPENLTSNPKFTGLACLLCTRRYHYNVSTQRLLVHVQKGWEDGLFVTSVASCDDLWAIVMDAGTEYTQQIYKVGTK